MSRRLYQHERAPDCRTVRWVLEKKRLDYQPIEVDPAVSEDLRRRFESDKPPILEDDAKAVSGARPIAFYLERCFESPSIFPADAQKRNQAATFAEFAEQAIGSLTAAILKRGRESFSPETTPDPFSELRACLGQVREAVARRALDSGACHLGDIAVAAHLVTCQDIPALEFEREYADLVAYVARVQRGLAGG